MRAEAMGESGVGLPPACPGARSAPTARGQARRPTLRRRRRDESGYALLLVLLMAALLALSLYREIPRVAFETERQKEELLVELGEQYQRALQVYVRALNHYPAKIEDLENTNNRHFLRRRYVDPMTGKDEWRLIHMQNGVLTDSKVQKQQPNQQKDNTTAIGQTVGQVAGHDLENQNQNQASAANLAMRKRAGDNLPPGAPGAGNGTGTPDPNNPGATLPGTTPGMPPGYPGMPPGYAPPVPESATTANGGRPVVPPGTPGAPGVQGIPGIPGLPGVPTAPGQPGQPGQPPTQFGGPAPTMPGTSGFNGTNTNAGGNNNNSGSGYLGGGGSYLGGGGSYLGGSSSPSGPAGTQGGLQNGGVSPGTGNPFNGGLNAPPNNMQQPGMTTPGFMPPGAGSGMQQMQAQAQGQAPNGAGLANMLGLTSPRPQGAPSANTNGMAAMGGGIAGFASKADADSIMVYNDQKNYGLWEFVFDPTKVPPLPNPVTGTVGTPAGAQIGTPATQVGTPASQMSNSNSGFGNSGFGNTGFGNSGGPGNSSFGNSGVGNSGMANPGTGNPGMGNPGFGNSGTGNSGGLGTSPGGNAPNGSGTTPGTGGGGVGGMGFPPPHEPPPPPPPF